MTYDEEKKVADIIVALTERIGALESELAHEASHRQKLQNALAYWMPGVTKEIEISTNGRCGDDAWLLVGSEGPFDDKCWGNEAIARAEAAEAEVKRLRDRYECWMPVTETPPAGMHPNALLHFYCISNEAEGDESPEYWKTETWQDKPADAVYWCTIVSPLGPHERTFIARTALASTGGEHNAE